jgi:putative Mg2+ transporter-C (MgtC) family protein
LSGNPPAFDIIDIVLRLGAGAVVGVLLGINRDLTNKPIGMWTLGLVSLGAAVVSVSTIHFQGLADHPDARSRVLHGVIQGIMAGIGLHR